MTGNIIIQNRSENITEIDIEGVIGINEEWQSENPESKITTYDRFKEKIKEINGINAPQIVVNIRSSGGDVNDAILIHDALCGLNAQITTRCFGYTASAATIIAQAASKGRREMSANGLYLIHKATTGTEGNSETLTQTVDLLNKTDERIASIYAVRSGRSTENFAELMECNSGNGRWLSPQEALEASLIDHIIEAKSISNNAKELITKLGLPKIPVANEHIKIQNPTKMNINQHWDAILNLMGISPKPENRISETSMQSLDIEMKKTETETLNPQNQSVVDQEEIGRLQNKLKELESQNARLKATATQTLPKEDPAVSETKLSSNALSYNEDVQNFTQLH